jgi:hypothetical protein
MELIEKSKWLTLLKNQIKKSYTIEINTQKFDLSTLSFKIIAKIA